MENTEEPKLAWQKELVVGRRIVIGWQRATITKVSFAGFLYKTREGAAGYVNLPPKGIDLEDPTCPIKLVPEEEGASHD